jgi:type III pantothenate kinase
VNLILDIGNTLAKVALIQDQETIFSKSYKELTLMDLDAILSSYSPQKAIASIVGKIRPELINLIQSRVTTIILDPSTPIPLKNQYSTQKHWATIELP